MSGRMKTLLFLVTLLAFGGGSIGLSMWWVQGKIEHLIHEAQAAEAEALAFSKTNTQRSCQVESIRRAAGCVGKSVCEAKANQFYKTCLRASTPIPGFCRHVPPRFGHDEASRRWAAGICAADGTVKQERCMRLQAILQDFCDTPEPWDEETAGSAKTTTSTAAEAAQAATSTAAAAE